jgi:hypothetical protein
VFFPDHVHFLIFSVPDSGLPVPLLKEGHRQHLSACSSAVKKENKGFVVMDPPDT